MKSRDLAAKRTTWNLYSPHRNEPLRTTVGTATRLSPSRDEP